MEPAQPKHDRDAAVACAEAFLRLAEPVVIRIGKDVPESTTQSRPFLPSMGNVAAAATNLAFAIELYIKAILIASKIDAPTGRDGHNLGKLHAAMPQHFKNVIERSYEETRKKDWNGRYPSITVAMRPVPANLPKWDDNRTALSMASSSLPAMQCETPLSRCRNSRMNSPTPSNQIR